MEVQEKVAHIVPNFNYAYPPGNYFSLQYFSVALLEAKLPFLEALSTLVITDANWAPRRATEKKIVY